MQDERPFAHLDELRQILLLLPNVDERIAVVVEDAEEAIDSNVDRGRLKQGVLLRVDLDPPLVEQPRDRAVGEDHSGRFYG